jgi:iron complex outermembrane receptor protein
MTYKEKNVMAHSKKTIRLSPICQAMGAAFFLAGSAVAQQADNTTSLPLVVITERSHQPSADVVGLGDTPLARTPVSVAVINAQQIDDSGAGRLADLLTFDASVSDAYNAVGYWDYITVRGYVLDNQFNYRREGLPINAETFIPLDNKAQVEILKGTSGMQAGTSAPGGLVNYAVKRPSDAPLRNVRLKTNSTGDTLLGVDLGNSFGASKEFGYRLNVVGESLNNVAPNTRGSRQLLALALDWRISHDTLLQVEGEYSRRSQPSVPGLSLLGTSLPAPDAKININNQPWSQPVVLEGVTGTVKLEQRLNSDWRWIAQLGTQRLKSDDRAAFPFGCTPPSGAWIGNHFCANGDFDLYDFSSNGEHRSIDAAQLQVKGRIDTGTVQHQVGAAWLNSSTRDRFNLGLYEWINTINLSSLQPQPLPTTVTLNAQGTDRTEHSNELSAYDNIAWTPQFSTWLGLRHTHLERSAAYPDGTTTSYAQSLTTPWSALTYQLTAEHMLYASWGQGMESKVVPNRPSQYNNPGEALPAVISRQSEFGIKAQDRDLSWQLNYFSIVRPATNLDACTSQCTAAYDGSDDHRGVEASTQWRGGPWSLLASATLMHARREGSVVDPTINGQVPTNVPNNILRAQADYRVSDLPGLTLQARLSHEGIRSVLPDGSVMLPSWNQLDSTLRYDTTLRGTPTTWILGVNNLLDRRFFKESPNQYGHAYLFPVAPRQLRISVQASL